MRGEERVPNHLRDEITKFVSRGDGDRERLKKLIESCKAYDDGRSALSEARRLCNPRWHALAKDLDEAIKAWQPPPYDIERSVEVEPAEAPPTGKSGERVPSNLADEITKFVSRGDGDRERLRKLIERCKAYDNGRSTLVEASRVCNPCWHALSKDLDEAIKAWEPPRMPPLGRRM